MTVSLLLTASAVPWHPDLGRPGADVGALTFSARSVGTTVSRGTGFPVSWSVAGQSAEAQEAVDPVTHFVYAAWMSGGWIWFARSADGGASFGRAQIVAGSQSFSNATTFAQSWNPAIATSANGTVYVANRGNTIAVFK
ncbi:MAG: hypothetical protein L3J91_06370, partial [Thermoplasmata archaeon]|nr:hypothetical protein [Thermoplasmata archaeon]